MHVSRELRDPSRSVHDSVAWGASAELPLSLGHTAAPLCVVPPGSLDNTFPVTSKPEAFFSKLQKFREANKEECICSDPE